MSARHPDRGLAAVRRVREARERDTRIGLQKALASARQREAEAEALRARLTGEPPFGTGTPGEFAAHARRVGALAAVASGKEAEARRGAAVADEARRRWAVDRQAVRAAELLLERRAEERRREQARREAADLDELGARAWLRGRTGSVVGGPAVTP